MQERLNTKAPSTLTLSAKAPSAKVGALVLMLAVGVGSGCSTGTTGDGDGDGDDLFGPIAFEDFVQDRPAIGGDWYLYDEDRGHILTPYLQAYLLREERAEGPRYAAIKISSYYDPASAESGVFSFSTKTWDGSAWGPETAYVAEKNIKSDGPYCFEIWEGLEVDCQQATWQFNFRIYKFLVRTGPIVVARPGLFVRQAPFFADGPPILAATLETETGLDGLPDPSTLAELADVAPTVWTDPIYAFDQWAPNLPLAGRVLGARWVDPGHVARPDVYFLLNALTELIRFTVVPEVDGDVTSGLRFTFASMTVERNGRTIATEVPELIEVVVPAPANGQTFFVDFEETDLLVASSIVSASNPPDLVPDEGIWELALEGTETGIDIQLSSGAILYNATARDNVDDLVTANPPQ